MINGNPEMRCVRLVHHKNQNSLDIHYTETFSQETQKIFKNKNKKQLRSQSEIWHIQSQPWLIHKNNILQ